MFHRRRCNSTCGITAIGCPDSIYETERYAGNARLRCVDARRSFVVSYLWNNKRHKIAGGGGEVVCRRCVSLSPHLWMFFVGKASFPAVKKHEFFAVKN
jgi:hypothetical protein